MIKEVIVVEGRNDVSAVKRALDTEVIAVHGFGITKETFLRIQKAYERTGIIVFTDPDFAGEKIRKRLTEKFPDCRHAYLSREAAMAEDGDIGIENASEESIRFALEKARCQTCEARQEFTMDDMIEYGLTGTQDAAVKRDKLGAALGIGYGNTKVFLNRLNHYGITREELEALWISSILQIK